MLLISGAVLLLAIVHVVQSAIGSVSESQLFNQSAIGHLKGVEKVVSHVLSDKVHSLFVPDCQARTTIEARQLCEEFINKPQGLEDLPNERDTLLCKGDYEGNNAGFEKLKDKEEQEMKKAICVAPGQYSCDADSFQKKIFDICQTFTSINQKEKVDHEARWSQGSTDGVTCNDRQITYDNYLDVVQNEMTLILQIASGFDSQGREITQMFKNSFSGDEAKQLEDNERWLAKFKSLHAMCCFPRDSCEECVTPDNKPTPFLQLMCAELVPQEQFQGLLNNTAISPPQN